jgi:hypothetical protein
MVRIQKALMCSVCFKLKSGLLSVYSGKKKTHLLRKTKGYLISEDLGADEVDIAHDGKYSLDEPNVEHQPGEFKVTKVAWALCHPSHACLTLDFSVDSSHPRVTKPTGFQLPLLHSLHILFAPPTFASAKTHRDINSLLNNTP